MHISKFMQGKGLKEMFLFNAMHFSVYLNTRMDYLEHTKNLYKGVGHQVG